MGHKKETEDSILELFYENPSKVFTIRDIEKITNVPRATVHNYLIELKEKGLINEDNISSDNFYFKTRKINYFMEQIAKFGLLDFIVQELNPTLVILFGSIRKGESNKDSDIDIFIESSIKKKIDFSQFEKKLKHPINIVSEEDINNMPSPLQNNILNGIKLYGVINLK